MTAGTPGLRMPAFSAAMCARVGPRYSWWSSPIEVTTQTSGAQMFVASSRPPRPVSSTITSTRRRANSIQAAAVMSSKKVGARSGSAAAMAAWCGRRISAKATTRSSESGRLSTWIRSPIETRCGLV